MRELEQNIYQYLVERGWDKPYPADLVKSLSIEAAELMEVFQWSHPTLEEVQQDDQKLTKVKEELADVLIYALELSVLLKLDTQKIVTDKLDKVKKKYPADLMRQQGQHAKPGEDSTYWEIKRQHRKENA